MHRSLRLLLRQSFCNEVGKNKLMKQYSLGLALVLVMSTLLTSCEIVGDIFKAGFYSAFIVIIIVVGLIIWLVSRFRK